MKPTRKTMARTVAAVMSPDYAEASYGTTDKRGALIYHRDPNSPSGLRLALVTSAEALTRALAIKNARKGRA